VKKIYKIIIILLIGIALIFIGAISFSSYVEKKIISSINKNNSNLYITNVANVDFKLFNRSLILKDIFYGPRSNSNPDSLAQIIKNDSLEKTTISSIIIRDIHYLDFIRDKYIRIGKVEFNNIFIRKTNKKTKSEPDSKPVNIDSIYIEKISGFEIDRFDFNNVQFTVVDSLTHEVLFHHKPASFNLDGFQLKKVKDQIFKVELIDKVFKIDNIILDVGNENYNLSIKEVNLDTKTSDVQIIDLKLNPFEGKMALANKFKYNDVVLNFDIERIQLSHIDFTKLFKNQGIFVDSIIVTKGVFDFYKDKRKPFNEKLVKKLPQELLKDLKTPLFIDHISLDSCQILAENRFPHKDLHMKLYFNHINGKITNISNIKRIYL